MQLSAVSYIYALQCNAHHTHMHMHAGTHTRTHTVDHYSEGCSGNTAVTVPYVHD